MARCGDFGGVNAAGEPCGTRTSGGRCHHHPGPGRPTLYTDAVAEEILNGLAAGDSLRAICRADHLPAASTVRGWVVDDREDFSERYARAAAIRLDGMADEVLEIADDGTGDIWTDEKGRQHVNNDVIQRSRLRVDTRKWLLSKLRPERYGDKAKLEHSGPGGGPIETNANVTFYVPDNARGDDGDGGD